MIETRYRLKTSTMGIQNKDGHPGAVVVPADAILTIRGEFSDANGLVDCEWDGGVVSLFVRDIQERGEAVGYSASAG